MNDLPVVRWIFLVAGEDPVFWKQATLAICSVLGRSQGRAKIVVYTDQPSRYVWLRGFAQVEKLAPALLAEWIGPERFFFRAKPCLLLHHLDRHPSEAVFYLDSDTLCTDDPLALEARLQAGAFFMHCPEYRVCDNQTKERREYSKRLLNHPLADGLALRDDSIMWNAGLLGVHPKDRELVENVLKAVDAMTALGLSPRTRLKEQLAFSLAAQATGRLEAIGDHFVHYWGNKDAWERWTDLWLINVLNAKYDPIAAGVAIAALPAPPAAVAPRKTRSERRKAKWRKFLRLD